MKCSLFFSVSPVLPLSSPSFSLVYPLCVCAYVCVRVRESVVSDDSEAVASCRHCRWQIWTKKGREERNRLQTAWAILTERLSGLSEQIGKVTNCDSVVMSHSLNYTLLYLTFHFHFNELVFKKMSCPFIPVKVALEAATSYCAWAVYHNYCVFMQRGYRSWGAVSNLAPFKVRLPSRLCSSGCCKNSNRLKESASGVNSLVQCYAGWQSKRRSKKTIRRAASAAHPSHSFVFSLAQ